MENKAKKRRPADGASYIVIEPSEGVRIEGCRQLLECSEVLARVRTRKYTVEILGSGLRADVFSSDTVEIGGNIISVTLEVNGRGDREK